MNNSQAQQSQPQMQNRKSPLLQITGFPAWEIDPSVVANIRADLQALDRHWRFETSPCPGYPSISTRAPWVWVEAFSWLERLCLGRFVQSSGFAVLKNEIFSPSSYPKNISEDFTLIYPKTPPPPLLTLSDEIHADQAPVWGKELYIFLDQLLASLGQIPPLLPVVMHIRNLLKIRSASTEDLATNLGSLRQLWWRDYDMSTNNQFTPVLSSPAAAIKRSVMGLGSSSRENWWPEGLAWEELIPSNLTPSLPGMRETFSINLEHAAAALSAILAHGMASAENLAEFLYDFATLATLIQPVDENTGKALVDWRVMLLSQTTKLLKDPAMFEAIASRLGPVQASRFQDFANDPSYKEMRSRYEQGPQVVSYTPDQVGQLLDTSSGRDPVPEITISADMATCTSLNTWETVLFQKPAVEQLRSLIGVAKGLLNSAKGNSAITHVAFVGEPGSGRRLLARNWARLSLRSLGVREDIWISGSELGKAWGSGNIGEVWKKAQTGGMLVVDDSADCADIGAWRFLQEALSQPDNNVMLVIVTTSQQVQQLASSTPELSSRIRLINLENYTVAQLIDLTRFFASSNNTDLPTSNDFTAALGERLEQLSRTLPGAKSAAAISRELTVAFLQGQNLTESLKPDKEVRTLEQILSDMETMTGLEAPKKELRALIASLSMAKLREDAGVKTDSLLQHMVFAGPPGTGKTTIARVVAEAYYASGLLRGGQLVEVSRADLVAGFVGQTALKVKEVIDRSLGGVLFIDEAYSLYSNDPSDFANEALAELVKAMEDHREDFVLIAAGYEEPMKDFVKANPGLSGRFSRWMEFPAYTPRECGVIFIKMSEEAGMLLGFDEEKIEELFAKIHESETFANARTARQLLQSSMSSQALRLFEGKETSTENVRTLLWEDLEKALVELKFQV